MAMFEYKAATGAGEVVNGVLAGTSRASVIAQLQALGHVPIRVNEAAEQTKTRRSFQWLSLIHISEPTRPRRQSRMPSSA